jgi:hypothetical protein
MSKIQNIDHCWECKEHYDYGWNNLDRCGETGKLLSDIEVIPTWCPLPDKDGWLPIESAPKDTSTNVEYILISDGQLPDLVVWHGERPERIVNGNRCLAIPEGWFICCGPRSRITNPTHWQPLPSSPKAKE